MTTTTTLLPVHVDALKADGEKIGDRTALDMLRCEQDGCDFLNFDQVTYSVKRALWVAGVDWDQLTIDQKVEVHEIWNVAYKAAYNDTFYEGED